MSSRRKKAIMGIGTLIIFIATILVAAVAAGVLISTSGVLQQRALITGQEARKKITNAIEIIQIVAYGNKSDESLNNFEILVRLDAGSDPSQMKKFDLSFVGPTQAMAAKLASPSMNNIRNDPVAFYENISIGNVLDNETQQTIWDIDGDGISDRIGLLTQSGNDYLVINFTDDDADYALYSLEHDIGSITGTLEIRVEDGPIIGQDGKYYGYFQLDLNVTESNKINLSGSNYIAISKYFIGPCVFDKLPPDEFFCYEVIHGDIHNNNDVDDVIGDGEVFKLKFRLSNSERMFIGQEFQFLFSQEKGRMVRTIARTPDIIQTYRVILWPVA